MKTYACKRGQKMELISFKEFITRCRTCSMDVFKEISLNSIFIKSKSFLEVLLFPSLCDSITNGSSNIDKNKLSSSSFKQAKLLKIAVEN